MKKEEIIIPYEEFHKCKYLLTEYDIVRKNQFKFCDYIISYTIDKKEWVEIKEIEHQINLILIEDLEDDYYKSIDGEDITFDFEIYQYTNYSIGFQFKISIKSDKVIHESTYDKDYNDCILNRFLSYLNEEIVPGIEKVFKLGHGELVPDMLFETNIDIEHEYPGIYDGLPWYQEE